MKLKWICIMALLFILISSSYSQEWQQTAGTPEGTGVTDMIVRESNGHIFVTTAGNYPTGDDGGIRRSTDDGATWENLADAFLSLAIVEGGDGNLYANIWDDPSKKDGLYRSTDNGDNWDLLTTVASDDNIYAIGVNAATSPTTIFAGTRKGIYRSTDNGSNWAFANNGIPTFGLVDVVEDIAVDTNGLVATATTKGLFISNNNGNEWKQIANVDSIGLIFKISFLNEYFISKKVITQNETKMYCISRELDGYEMIVKTEALKILIILEGLSVQNEFECMDAFLEAIWEFGLIAISGYEVNDPKSDNSGFFISIDNGSTLLQNNSGLPTFDIPVITGYPNQSHNNKSNDSTTDLIFYAGLDEGICGGAKIYTMTYTVETHIKSNSTQIPSKYNLRPCYPNPFNPKTTIKFDLPVEGMAKLAVYNLLGEAVDVLVNQKLSAGMHEYTWHAGELPSGVYFYKLETETFVDVKKMLLMK